MKPSEIDRLTERLHLLGKEIAQAEATGESSAFELAFSHAELIVQAIENLPILGSFEERMAVIRAKARAAIWCHDGIEDLKASATRDERLIGQVLEGLAG